MSKEHDVIDFKKINRIEIIDHTRGEGRILVKYLRDDERLEASVQDYGETLKIFVSKA